MVLFILLKSPFECNAIELMERLRDGNNDGVLLAEDAIYYATVSKVKDELLKKGYKIYAMQDDALARGFDNIEDVELIDYETAVDLIMEKYSKVISL
ncbi:sulfurtransferase complex subunit TusB [Methanocaldococcus sp. 16A]